MTNDFLKKSKIKGTRQRRGKVSGAQGAARRNGAGLRVSASDGGGVGGEAPG